jgi:catechol 2,3-dioxygenase-like lactoylglutathione lyase family enzyme
VRQPSDLLLRAAPGTEVKRMKCSCCGEEREPDSVAALLCHDHVKVCRVCAGWLRSQTGTPDSTPILPVRDIDEATAFYESAGFDVRLYEGGGFAFVERDDESVFDLDLAERLDPDQNHAGCYLIVRDVDAWHSELSSAGLPVTTLSDQPWGMREFTLTDPSGNHVRIGRSV